MPTSAKSDKKKDRGGRLTIQELSRQLTEKEKIINDQQTVIVKERENAKRWEYEFREKDRQYRAADRADPLIKDLGNKNEFEHSLQLRLRAMKKGDTGISVIFSDGDKFKQINDTYGHEIGNVILFVTAGLMKNNTRGLDLVCRHSGDEFMILLQNCDERGTELVKERLAKAIGTLSVHQEGTIVSVKAKQYRFASKRVEDVTVYSSDFGERADDVMRKVSDIFGKKRFGFSTGSATITGEREIGKSEAESVAKGLMNEADIKMQKVKESKGVAR